MSTTKQMALIVLLMVMGGAFFAYFVTWPNYTAWNRYKHNLTSLSNELSSLNEKKSLISQLEAAEPTLSQESQVAENFIPFQEERELFVSQIDALAQQDGVKLSTFTYTEAQGASKKTEEDASTSAKATTGQAAAKNDVKPLGYTAAISGTYQQVERFMIDLEHMNRYGQVKSFSMNPTTTTGTADPSAAPTTGGVSASLTGNIYTKSVPKVAKTINFSTASWQYLTTRLVPPALPALTRADPFVKP